MHRKLILSSLLMLLKINLSYLELFLLNGYWKYKVWNISMFYLNSNILNFFTSHGGYFLNTTLYVPGVGFSVAGLDRVKCGFNQFQSFLFIIVVIVVSILLKTVFWQTSIIHSQSLVKILWRMEKIKSLLRQLKKRRSIITVTWNTRSNRA